jgi:hypothetical protein
MQKTHRLDRNKTGRSTNGRFSRGNAGGPGRPPRKIEAAYLQATMLACSLGDWGAIVRRAVADAKRGNDKARDWLSKYLLGNPESVAALSPHQVAVDAAAGVDRVKKEASLKTLFGFGRTLQKARPLVSVDQKKGDRDRSELAHRREVVQKDNPLRPTRKAENADRLIRAVEMAAPHLLQ